MGAELLITRKFAVLVAGLAFVALAAAQERVTLNFVNTEIDAVVRAVAQLTGKTFIVDPRVKGTLNLTAEQPLSPGRKGYVHLARGEASVNGHALRAGDALKTDSGPIVLERGRGAEVLVFDLPKE